MLKKIIGTAGTRILNAFFTLIILLLMTNKLGSTELGIIGLIMVDITIIQLSVDLFAGSSLIYFASRSNIGKLLLTAYFFISIVIVLYYFLMLAGSNYFPGILYTIVPEGFNHHILGISLLGSLMSTHYNLLLGKQRIKSYNIIFTLQISTLLIVFLTNIYLLHHYTVMAYLTAMYWAYAAGAVIGFFTLLKNIGPLSMVGWVKTTKAVIRYGFITQVANLLSIGNNRMSFFFITRFSGLSALGVYYAGIQLTEGLKLIGSSIAVVQFSAISNTRDLNYAKQLTVKLMKFSVGITFLATLVLVVLPDTFYSWMFSKDFSGVKPVILALSPGVIALAANNIFSHYFSGLGNPKVNLYAKVVGFIFTIILAILLIPKFGLVGAAITASVSYISTVIYQYIVFQKHTLTPFGAWLITLSDFTDFRKLIAENLKKQSGENKTF